MRRLLNGLEHCVHLTQLDFKKKYRNHEKKYIRNTCFSSGIVIHFWRESVRSGSAGASELLINPWARTASWAEGNTANVMGLESLYGNIAGLAFTEAFRLDLQIVNG